MAVESKKCRETSAGTLNTAITDLKSYSDHELMRASDVWTDGVPPLYLLWIISKTQISL